MNEEGLSLTVEGSRVDDIYETAGQAVALNDLLVQGNFSLTKVALKFVVASGSVDVGDPAYAFSAPTAQWFGVYPQIKLGMELLEDNDVEFEPKRKRIVKGIIIGRRRGELITDSSDELFDE